MTKETKTPQKTLTTRLRNYVVIALLAWTALIAGLLGRDILEIRRTIQAMAVWEAASHFNKDHATQPGVSPHDGPNVPVTERKGILPTITSFSLLWLVGVAGILFVAKRLGTEMKDREKVEHALEISQKNYSAAFDNSLTGIYVMQDRKLKLANQTLADMYGYERQELIGMDSLQLVYPEDRPAVIALTKKRLKGEEVPSVYEVRSVRKDGGVFWVQRRNTLVSFDGKPAVLGNVLDITPLKEAEETVKRQTEELSRSNEELQAFASVASHDLQEPLRKIRTFGDVLQRKFAEPLGEEGSDYLHRMQKAAVRMQALIDALLSYSRVNAKGLDFKMVSLKDIVREVIVDLEVTIEIKGAKVHVGELPTAEADPVQMRQLFQNLISNSLKFGPEHGSPEVRIYAEAIQGAVPERVRITVEDNGIGFDSKFADRIFRPFERLHGHAAYEGAGMGLAISRKIVERHGGTIEARGVPGKGATFIITLPVKQEDNPPAQCACS
jgi:PAS domain S-box-containing protein